MQAQPSPSQTCECELTRHWSHTLRCRYFRTQFFKRGADNVSANSVVNRMYRFHFGSSQAFNAMLSFAYTASIPGAICKRVRSQIVCIQTHASLPLAHLHCSEPRGLMRTPRRRTVRACHARLASVCACAWAQATAHRHHERSRTCSHESGCQRPICKGELNQRRRYAELAVEAPHVHPLPKHLEDLLEITLHCPTVCPAQLAPYIIQKVVDAPLPSPKAAVAWAHFVQMQNRQVRPLRACATTLPTVFAHSMHTRRAVGSLALRPLCIALE